MEPERSSTTVEDFRVEWRDRRLHVTPEHRVANEKLITLYREGGLLPEDRDEALFCCCPHRNECWQGASEAKDSRNSGIALPWIGKGYFDSGVVILGINFDNFGGLAGHYHVCESHIEEMKGGKRGKDGRAFARGAMQYLRIVLVSLSGEDLPTDSADVTNQQLAPFWEDCAYLQRIKCAPGADRSKPTESMIRNCPPFLAMPELEILKPRVVLHLGRTDLRREWIVREGGYGEEQGPHMERDTATISGRAVELISLNHPSTSRAGNIAASLEQLIASLEEKPLASSAVQ
jgi:Uracil DNA glycosylase superfamily